MWQFNIGIRHLQVMSYTFSVAKLTVGKSNGFPRMTQLGGDQRRPVGRLKKSPLNFEGLRILKRRFFWWPFIPLIILLNRVSHFRSDQFRWNWNSVRSNYYYYYVIHYPHAQGGWLTESSLWRVTRQYVRYLIVTSNGLPCLIRLQLPNYHHAMA